MSIKMVAYKNGSASAKALAEALGIKMLKKQGSKWRGKQGDTIINWGQGTPIEVAVKGHAAVINRPMDVAKASNKLSTQRELAKHNNPYALPWTTSREEALKMIADGKTVVCRTKLTGHSGEGIVIATKAEEIVMAPLYTEYKKKKSEFRVHVFNGEVIDVQRKARRKEVPDADVNWQVRNLDGGFIFARKDILAPMEVLKAALTAVEDLGLNNGAVDVGYHDKEGVYVYEVNTACGLDGSTLHNYAKAYAKLLGIPENKLKLPEIEGGYQPMLPQMVIGRKNGEFEIREVAKVGQEAPAMERWVEPKQVVVPEPVEEEPIVVRQQPKALVFRQGLRIKAGNFDFEVPAHRMAAFIEHVRDFV